MSNMELHVHSWFPPVITEYLLWIWLECVMYEVVRQWVTRELHIHTELLCVITPYLVFTDPCCPFMTKRPFYPQNMEHDICEPKTPTSQIRKRSPRKGKLHHLKLQPSQGRALSLFKVAQILSSRNLSQDRGKTLQYQELKWNIDIADANCILLIISLVKTRETIFINITHSPQ